MKASRLIILFLISLLPVLPLASQPMLPDNRETRLQLRELITAPTADILEAPERTFSQFYNGLRVGFRIRQQNGSYYMLFLNEKNGLFPTYSRGSYIIKRDLEDGSFVQVKIFLKDDPGCFARIYPWDDRSRMEITLYDRLIYDNINLPLSFPEVLTASFEDIISVTGYSVDWELVFPEAGLLGSEKLALLSAVREKLPLINDAEDGAMDADGSYRFIEDLSVQPEPGGFNCSGFVKWVADGIYGGITGNYLNIEGLRKKHLDQRGNRWSARHEDDRDPYFGLDWTRNIAAAIENARSGEEGGYRDEDVISSPWSGYSEDIGFPVEDLKLVMYCLAIEEPEYIYLASVNVPWGTGPVLRQHVHTAVLFPYIEKDGSFHDVVLERNIESDSAGLAAGYPGAHVHLVRLKADSGFRLPDLENKPAIGGQNYFRR